MEDGRAVAESALLMMEAGLPVPDPMLGAALDYILGCVFCRPDWRNGESHQAGCPLGELLNDG